MATSYYPRAYGATYAGSYADPGVASETAHRVYDKLPEWHRDFDAAQAGDHPLLRYLSLIGDQLEEMAVLAGRIGPVPKDEGGAGGTSALADPGSADAAWLPWLAQLVGATISNRVPLADRRAALASGAGWRAGTRDSIAAAVRPALTGGRMVAVHDHSVAGAGGVGAGDAWHVLIVTRASETPSAQAVLDAVAPVKPAGVVLAHQSFEASWAALQAAYPLWSGRNNLSWATIQEAGLT